MTKISWYIKEDDEYMEHEDYHAGSHSNEDVILLNIQVWNNRGGMNDSDTIDNAYLSIEFEKADDNTILNFMRVNVNDTGFVKPNVSLDRADVELGILSGYKNDGIANIKNKDNYKNILIEIAELPKNMRSGLRNMLFNVCSE